MLFRKLQLDDIAAVKQAMYLYSPNQSNDYTITGLFLWRDYLNGYVAYENDEVYVYQYIGDRYLFYLPLCKDIKTGLKKIIDYCESNHLNYGFYPVTEENINYLDSINIKYEIIKNEDNYDYLYYTTELAEFKGKKFHTHKNHINKFDKEYSNYSFERITEANLFEVQEFFDRYIIEKQDEQIDIAEQEEHRKIPELLTHMEDYNLFGFCVKINQVVQGFELGEIVGNMYYSHIQKANKKIDGIYTKMVNLMAKELEEKVIYINREEDWGEPGLRVSKKRYHPCGFIEKYIIFI